MSEERRPTEKPWRTAIGKVAPNEIRVRGYDLMELIGTRSFGDVTYLLLSGELPEGNEGRMVEAMLVSAAEHSIVAPSVAAARYIASTGVPLQAAVSVGVAGMGDFHGGAVEAGALMLREAADLSSDPSEAADGIVRAFRERGERIPGYGHVVHDPDPRGRRLLEVAGDLGLRGRWCVIAQEIEPATERHLGRRLAMNVDGAMAALLLELGLDPGLGKAFYVIGRTPGLVAHVHEERTRERPYRDPGWENVEYDGPPPRDLP
ncbi:MAG TPA: citryl-CoA lyase [Actinomycetota bacterium]